MYRNIFVLRETEDLSALCDPTICAINCWEESQSGLLAQPSGHWSASPVAGASVAPVLSAAWSL